MYKALVFKEWRELWWTGVIALLVLCCVVWDEVGLFFDLENLAIVRRHTGRIPFRSDDMQMAVTSVACCLAVVLGLWQTLGESVRGTWRYLRQRPIAFSRLLMTKLAAGLGLLLISTGLPLALYLMWAASDGLHSSPFEWEMAAPTFLGWTASTTVYLAAFLVGIREARWYGSRLWPFAPVVVLYLYFGQFETSTYAAGAVICVGLLALLGGILYSAVERDD
ncbi:MAG TPA: hypothetical protein VGH74_15915 [Planctomycetaceae bacterium]|jgi:hypothetical protein